jgi:hypothetical protein
MLAEEPVDERCDIYMAGMTMLSLVDEQHLPDSITAILRWATSKDPDRRPQDGRELLDRLTTAIRREWGKQYRQLNLP